MSLYEEARTTSDPAKQISFLKDYYQHAKSFLAENPNLIPEVQQQLADDKVVYVRQYLAKNPNLISKVQHQLARDKDVLIRTSLAQNINLEPAVQVILAYDSDKIIRRHLEQNKNITIEAWQILQTQKNITNRQRFQQGLSSLTKKNIFTVPNSQFFLNYYTSYQTRDRGSIVMLAYEASFKDWIRGTIKKKTTLDSEIVISDTETYYPKTKNKFNLTLKIS